MRGGGRARQDVAVVRGLAGAARQAQRLQRRLGRGLPAPPKHTSGRVSRPSLALEQRQDAGRVEDALRAVRDHAVELEALLVLRVHVGAAGSRPDHRCRAPGPRSGRCSGPWRRAPRRRPSSRSTAGRSVNCQPSGRGRRPAVRRVDGIAEGRAHADVVDVPALAVGGFVGGVAEAKLHGAAEPGQAELACCQPPERAGEAAGTVPGGGAIEVGHTRSAAPRPAAAWSTCSPSPRPRRSRSPSPARCRTRSRTATCRPAATRRRCAASVRWSMLPSPVYHS